MINDKNLQRRRVRDHPEAIWSIWPSRVISVILALVLTVVSPLLADDSEEEAQITSVRAERREILLYGIDTQVLEVLKKIEEERDELLLDDIFVTYKITKNPRIKIAAIEVFDTLEYFDPLDDVLEIITDWEVEDSSLVVRAIDYVSHERNDLIADSILPLTDVIDAAIARAAVQAIGRVGSEIHADALLERFESSDFETDLKPTIILAFGELKSNTVVDALIDILDNPDEDMTWRRYACDSLGKIADPRAIPAIERALVDEDAMLRAYAVSSIRYFEDQNIAPALMQGLRDSFWRVRVSAARALGELGAESALPILGFKARMDPETNVREEAIRAIGSIGATGSAKAFDTIREYYEDRTFPLALRITCVELLTKYDSSGSVDAFTRVITRELAERDSKILERTAYFLSLIDVKSDDDGKIPSGQVVTAEELKTYYEQFLSSKNLVLTIYGIRGAERNEISSLKETIQSLSEEGNHRSIRRAAIGALENL